MKKIDPKYLLALNAHPKIGSQTLKKILAAFEDPEEAWKTSNSILTLKLGEKITALILEARSAYSPAEELEKLSKFDVGYITIYDKKYPPLLREIPDAPALLYIRGDLEILSRPALAIVGSRKYSQYGAKVAATLSKSCATNGLVIVSGLALGIDGVAHQATLDAGGLTVGVLGCGLDRIYPVSNYQIGKDIIEKGGAIISEYSLGTPPLVPNFPIRNRIIAGLSLGTLVVEAALDSGSLITAGLALEYNREVFAVPGNIDSMMSEGTNKLIKMGAIPVTEVSDILQVLNIEEKSNEMKAREILADSVEESKLLALLKTGEKSGDELVILSKLDVMSVNTTLTLLEMKGLVQNIGGGRYKLK
ncbi:MAG: DNA-processing protein DprA [Candidatus Berkelbacteria bacterium]|nr:DNA-processing protein DprA [Candidatus Berkelbacteria bacterium]